MQERNFELLLFWLRCTHFWGVSPSKNFISVGIFHSLQSVNVSSYLPMVCVYLTVLCTYRRDTKRMLTTLNCECSYYYFIYSYKIIYLISICITQNNILNIFISSFLWVLFCTYVRNATYRLFFELFFFLSEK